MADGIATLMYIMGGFGVCRMEDGAAGFPALDSLIEICKCPQWMWCSLGEECFIAKKSKLLSELCKLG